MKYYIVLVGDEEIYEDIDKMMAEWVADGYINSGYNNVRIKKINDNNN